MIAEDVMVSAIAGLCKFNSPEYRQTMVMFNALLLDMILRDYTDCPQSVISPE